MAPTLFSKKSKPSLRDKPITVIINEHGYPKHARSMSTTSTSSSTSSTVSHSKPHTYDPLSLHPPLSFNTSPVIDEEDTYQRHPNLEQNQDNNNDDDDLESPLDYYFNQDNRRRTYVYDQQVQWPLKDWQSVPPGLANLDDDNDDETPRCAVNRTNTSSSAESQRRPRREFDNSLEDYVKHGEWKRRGIVFGLDSDAEDEQTRHFEVNPFELTR